MLKRFAPFLVVLTCLWPVGICTATGTPDPAIEGAPPPALTPFAADDPIPKLNLHVHTVNQSGKAVVESFLTHLATGLNPERTTTCTLLGEREGYQRAWALMDEATRPPLQEFQRQWSNTVRLAPIQLERMTGARYFVELQRLTADSTSTFYAGEITATQTPQGWRIRTFRVHPEDLLCVTLFGHQAWLHSAVAVAQVTARAYLGQDQWDVTHLSYQGRVAIARVERRGSKEIKSVRLVRQMEGSWRLLSIT